MSKTKRYLPVRNNLVEAMFKRTVNQTKKHKDKRDKRSNRQSWKKDIDIND